MFISDLGGSGVVPFHFLVSGTCELYKAWRISLTTHQTHRFTDGDSSEKSPVKQSRIHSPPALLGPSLRGLGLEHWARRLKAVQRTGLVGSVTSYSSSQGARTGIMSVKTWVPSPAPWHTWGGEVWHHLWMPQCDLVLSPLSRFLRLTGSDTRMVFQQQNLKYIYICFNNELISTHANFSHPYSDFFPLFL